MAASGGDIRAGKAFVELYVKNSALMKGLADAQKRLRDFGNGIASVGKWMMGLGAAVVAPFAAMVARFESTGSALNDMSARTGMTVEMLSSLGFAAEQSGAGLEDVETACRKSQKAIMDAARGGEAGTKALANLGLTFDELKSMSPDQQFELIAAKLAQIKNPTQQAAAALEIFGKTGTALLPMIGDMDALRNRAEKLGQVMTTEDAAAADAFGDAMKELKDSLLSVGNGVAAELLPPITSFLSSAAEVVAQIKQWATENSDLIATVLKVAAGFAAVGVGVFVFGKIIAGVGFLLGGLSGFIMWAVSGVQLLVGVLGMVISPALLIGAAIVGIVAALIYLARNTAPVQAVADCLGEFVDGIKSMFNTLVSDAMAAWDGITAALSAGDIKGAIKVVTATISLEWTRVTTWLTETWQGFLSIWSGITNKIKSFMLDAIAAIRSAWADAMTTMANMWDTWTATLYKSHIYRTITTKAVGLVMGDDFAKTMDDVMQQEAKATPQRIAARNADNAKEKGEIEKTRVWQQSALAEDKKRSDDARAKKIADAQKELDDAVKARDASVAAAKDSKKKADSDNAKKSTRKKPNKGLSVIKDKAIGTFSASAVSGLFGGNVAQQIAKNTAKTFQFVGEQTSVAKSTLKAVEKINLKAAP